MTLRNGDSHRRWEELAAGHALGGLDADDERLFAGHLANCARCAALVASHDSMLARIDDATDTGELEEFIRATLNPALGAGSAPARPAQRGRRQLVAAVAAALALVIAGLGAGVGLTRSSPRLAGRTDALGQNAALLSCLQDAACRHVPLTAPDGTSRAVTLVHGNSVLVVPAGLGPTRTHVKTYGLWQLPASGQPVPLATFDVPTGRASVIPAGQLALDVVGSQGFMISLEPRGVALREPTQPLAVGTP